MNTIMVNIPNKSQHYDILIEEGLLKQPNRWLPKNIGRCIVVSDNVVDHYYGDQLSNGLKALGIDLLRLTVPAGESSKSNETKLKLESEMFKHACDRSSLILALGGGVIGDLSGFLAATYMRGIDYIQLPTSLLAMVDSSIGGKVGINHNYGKNLIGAFRQPKAVVSDIACLATLPKIHRLYGLIEAAKMFITFDKANFKWMNSKNSNQLLTDNTLLSHLITHAASIKAKTVMIDPHEQTGLRAVLNFGHTIGHALEKISGYQLPHADAVALGILVEIHIARLMNILSANDCTLIEKFFLRFGINIDCLKRFDIDDVLLATQTDKKNKNKKVHYVLLKTLGEAFFHQGHYTHLVDEKIIKEAWTTVKMERKI